MNDRDQAPGAQSNRSVRFAMREAKHRSHEVGHVVRTGVSASQRTYQLSAYVRLMRPHQWTKNAVVLAGVAFSGQASDPAQLARAVVAVLAFCLVSSAVYGFNDWHDRVEDRLHPTKRFRPIAAHEAPPSAALGLSGGLLVISVVVAWLIAVPLAGVILVYAFLMAAYTIWFRRLPIVDVLTIATGFVLRAIGGAVAVAAPISMWLFVCTLLLALMLGLGKRRHELRMLHGETMHHRPSLAGYARIGLDRVMLVVGLLTLGAYTLYSIAVPSYGRTVPMIATLPFVAVAIVRYLYLVLRLNQGGSPEVLLIRDRPLFLSIAVWSVAVAIVLAS